MFIPDHGYESFTSRITDPGPKIFPDPGSMGQKGTGFRIPGPGLQHWLIPARATYASWRWCGNTGYNHRRLTTRYPQLNFFKPILILLRIYLCTVRILHNMINNLFFLAGCLTSPCSFKKKISKSFINRINLHWAYTESTKNTSETKCLKPAVHFFGLEW